MPSLPAAILEKSLTLPKGHVLSPKEFIHLGSRAAVDQAFSRLAKAGSLLRVARGIYVACAQGKAGTHEGGTEAVVLSIAAKGKAAITSNGAVAAKSFGLIAQTPDEVVFLTSGRSKQLTVGATGWWLLGIHWLARPFEHWPGWEQSALRVRLHSFTANFPFLNGRFFRLFGLVYPAGWPRLSVRPASSVD
jgi:hypothetical protein